MIVVTGAIIRDGRILLIQRMPKVGWPMLDFVFATPGGRCECGESKTDALKRKLLKELGLRITNQFDRVAYAVKLDCPVVSQAIDLTCYVIPHEIIDGVPQTLEGVEGFAWFDSVMLRTIMLAPADASCVDALCELLK